MASSSLKITAIAKTVAEILGVEPPNQAGQPLNCVLKRAEIAFGGKKATRVFMYNPDAVALWLYQKYTEMFTPAIAASDIQLPLLSVMPSVTPVCFASMYSGANPDIHGIQAYVKPVLRTDTVFDALIRAGKKPAIVSTAGDSISCIFLQRNMDYFLYDTHQECTEKAFELIERDEHDLIVLYNGNYDTTMHRTGTEDARAMRELQSNIETYAALERKIAENWRNHRTLLAFSPDHGCHDIDGKLGSHGLDMPEDMNVIHMFKFLGA